MRAGGLGVELSKPHVSRAERVRVPPHHGGSLIAEGVGLERRDVWVDCPARSGCSHATVDVDRVHEAVDRWVNRHPL